VNRRSGANVLTTLSQYSREMLPLLERELRRQVRRVASPGTRPFHDMLAYHMGWEASPRSRRGKRVRPLLLLLTCASLTEDWRDAAPAAAALELVHNFSLIHDDIQDNSTTRRGRPTVWVRAGIPLAINSGDALFTVAIQAGLDLSRSYDPRQVVTANAILHQSCLDLTKGQYLDLHHQRSGQLDLSSYWKMIDGKTAALLAAGTHIGALLGGAGPRKCYSYRAFGRLLGLAFQVRDDILGIWGEERRTGKSVDSDLIEGKLSLPVVYALGQSAAFRKIWQNPSLRARSAGRLRRLLDDVDARKYADQRARRLTTQALLALKKLRPRGDAGRALVSLSSLLLRRQT